MTFMRHFHRNAWCAVCKDQTPHDEDGKGLCIKCVRSIDSWISEMDKPTTVIATERVAND